MKPIFLSGYADDYAKDYARLLITLLRSLGPLAQSMYLIGGLTPRFIIKKRPPDAPRHVGTQDVDVVLDRQILTDIEALHTLEGALSPNRRNLSDLIRSVQPCRGRTSSRAIRRHLDAFTLPTD